MYKRHPPPSEGTDVNPEKTSQELKVSLLRGWLVSFALHGLLIVSLSPLFRHSLTTFPKEPFQLDVMLVQTTQIADESTHITDQPKPAIPKRPYPTTTASRANRKTRHATSSSEHNPPRKWQTATPVEPEVPSDIPSSIPSLKESPTASISEPAPSVLSQTSDPLLLPAATQFDSTTQAPSQPEAAAVPATTTEQSTPPSVGTQPSPPPTMASAPAPRPRPDYGWLQQAIFRRLDDLKRSSQPFLNQSRPLKVLVKAIVSRDGALLDLAVVKCSGLDHIDQKAMTLVQRAFPMQFDRTLDRQQIVMGIPITYSRE